MKQNFYCHTKYNININISFLKPSINEKILQKVIDIYSSIHNNLKRLTQIRSINR